MKLLQIFVFLIVLITACKRESTEVDKQDVSESHFDRSKPEYRDKHTPGHIHVTFRNDVTAEDVFSFITAFDHPVIVMLPGMYESALPSDSLDYVKDQVGKRKYLEMGEGASGENLVMMSSKQSIVFYPYMTEMHNRSNQTDWLQLMDDLKLTSLGFRNDLVLMVPVGEEKEWQDEFAKHRFVKSTSLLYPID